MATVKSINPLQRPRFNGYTDAQIEHILSKIATEANVLREFAANASVDADGGDMYMTKMIAERIGLLADLPLRGDCVGGISEWMLGPSFAKKGEGNV